MNFDDNDNDDDNLKFILRKLSIWKWWWWWLNRLIDWFITLINENKANKIIVIALIADDDNDVFIVVVVVVDLVNNNNNIINLFCFGYTQITKKYLRTKKFHKKSITKACWKSHYYFPMSETNFSNKSFLWIIIDVSYSKLI